MPAIIGEQYDPLLANGHQPIAATNYIHQDRFFGPDIGLRGSLE
jgi:hypothetical protein